MDTTDTPLGPLRSRFEFDAASCEDRWCDDGGQGALYEEKPLSPTLRYPLYLIANDKGILVANSGGKDCVLLFHLKELAERHIAQTRGIGPLYPLAIPNAEAFRQGLESLPADVTCAIWDATAGLRPFVNVNVAELFLALDEE